MAAFPSVSSDADAGLLELLGHELYDDYFGEREGEDSY